MLEKEEYHVAYHRGRKWIVCDRIDMVKGIDEELLKGTFFAYRCPSEKQSALQWKKVYESFTQRPLTITSSRHQHGQRSVFLGKLGCVRRTNYRSTRKKGTSSARDIGCPAGLILYVRTCEPKRSRLPTAGGYNLRVYSNGKPHNHAVESALRYRRPADATRAALLELFDQHHTPASALETLKMRLLQEHGDNYLTVAADRGALPDKGFVAKVFYETYHERYGTLSRREVRKLQESARRGSAAGLGQRDSAPVSEVLVLERPSCLDGAGGGDCISPPFDDCGELPDGWFDSEEHHDIGGRPGGDAAVGASPLAACSVGELCVGPPGDVIVYYTGGVSSETVVCDVLTEPIEAATDAGVSSETVVCDVLTEPIEAAADTGVSSETVVCDVLTEPIEAAADTGVSSETVVCDVLTEPIEAATVLAETADLVAVEAAGDRLQAVACGGPAAAQAGLTDLGDAARGGPAAGPPAEVMAQRVADWATELGRQMAWDDGGQWRRAAAAFLENWERLPGPGRLAGLQLFGRCMSQGQPEPCSPRPGGRSETVATQTETATPSVPLCVLRRDGDWDDGEDGDDSRALSAVIGSVR